MRHYIFSFKSVARPKEICPEAARLLEDWFVTPGMLDVLKKMKPGRQVEAAEHIVAAGNLSIVFARGLLEITPTESRRLKFVGGPNGCSQALINMLQQQAPLLARMLNRFRETHGEDMLTLTVCCKYVERLLSNERISYYIRQFHPKVFTGMQAVVSRVAMAATLKRRGAVTVRTRRKHRSQDVFCPSASKNLVQAQRIESALKN